MFSSFIGKNSTAEKAKLLLAYSDFYITFASETVGCMLGIFQQQTERNLKHYEHDSLKLEAAKFLIRNMPIVL